MVIRTVNVSTSKSFPTFTDRTESTTTKFQISEKSPLMKPFYVNSILITFGTPSPASSNLIKEQHLTILKEVDSFTSYLGTIFDFKTSSLELERCIVHNHICNIFHPLDLLITWDTAWLTDGDSTYQNVPCIYITHAKVKNNEEDEDNIVKVSNEDQLKILNAILDYVKDFGDSRFVYKYKRKFLTEVGENLDGNYEVKV